MGWIVAVVIVGLFINAFFASLMRTVAISKGYKNTPVFALVFFFGTFGMLYVIALPDLVARQHQKNISDLLFVIKQYQENSDAPEPSPISLETLEKLTSIKD